MMGAVSELPGLDLSGLRAWLDEQHPGLLVRAARPPTALTGGRSNLTYLVQSPQARVVLRRPPLGEQPATAHDVAREFRIITALGAVRGAGAARVSCLRGPGRDRCAAST